MIRSNVFAFLLFAIPVVVAETCMICNGIAREKTQTCSVANGSKNLGLGGIYESYTCQQALDLAKSGTMEPSLCSSLDRQPPGVYPHSTDKYFDYICDCRDCIPAWCFSKANVVEVQGKGLVRMDKIQIGDFVQDGEKTFSRVYSLGHLDHDVESEFLQIHATGLDSPLEITTDHLMFIKNEVQRAKNVKVHDIIGIKGHHVDKISTVKRRGFYAPFTESGTLVVSGVLASSYSPWLPDLHIPAWLQAYVFHAVLAPRRFMCRWDFDLCMKETYDQEGFPTFAVPFLQLYYILAGSGLVVQGILVAAWLPWLMGMLVIEQLWSCLGILSTLIASVLLCRVLVGSIGHACKR